MGDKALLGASAEMRDSHKQPKMTQSIGMASSTTTVHVSSVRPSTDDIQVPRMPRRKVYPPKATTLIERVFT